MDNFNSGLYIPDDGLFDFAAASAKLLRPDGECSGRDEAALLRRSMAAIRRCHSLISRRYGAKSSVPAAFEWIMDNFYIIEREGASASAALRRARRLRAADGGSMIGELCRALVRSGRGEVTEARCLEFLRGFQSVTALRRAELYLFPAALRAALIHGVAAVCRAMEFADGSDEYAPALEALFGALRLFAVLDLENLLDSADMTAEALRADPDGVFQRMDSASRGEYLRRIEYLSRREGVEEHIYARRLVKKARAVLSLPRAEAVTRARVYRGESAADAVHLAVARIPRGQRGGGNSPAAAGVRAGEGSYRLRPAAAAPRAADAADGRGARGAARGAEHMRCVGAADRRRERACRGGGA